MPTTHYKRLLMEIDLRRVALIEPTLPAGYAFAAWHPLLVDSHALAKHHSFSHEIDAEVFESLSDLPGCKRLMTDISHHQGFLPLATWLIRFEGNEFAGPQPVATIQGLRKSQWVGSIQNVGVVPAHRGFGLGKCLLQKCLLGFQQIGTRTVRLEVTAANRPAVALYDALGFRLKRTSYRSVTRATEPAVIP
ncbi:MAG: N-acetyltransferase [Planctomycetaceae bacterium]